MMRLNKFILGFVLFGLFIFPFFVSSSPQDIEIEVPENLTIMPDSEFAIIVAMLNNGFDREVVDISVVSEDLGINIEKEVGLEGYDRRKIEINVPPVLEVGHYDIYWVFRSGTEIILQKKTHVQVSRMAETIGDILFYYGNQISRLEDEGHVNSYLDDAKKHLEVAEELYKNGMYFEAMKYVDLVRESLSLAVVESIDVKTGNSIRFSGIKNISAGVYLNIILATLSFILLVFGGLLIKKKLLKKIKTEVKEEKCENKKDPQESLDYTTKIRALRDKVNQLKDIGLVHELNMELDQCEEKFKLGLVNLGNAYCKKIEEKLKED